MREVIEKVNGKTLFKGKSPDGYTRYWIESGDSIQMFNGNWYKLNQVLKVLNGEKNG
tara:strand:- start:110 stop:280 length:171 start_codon:yes stop_codon:yes gene_type:complete